MANRYTPRGEMVQWLQHVAESSWPVCIRWDYPTVSRDGYGVLRRPGGGPMRYASAVVCEMAHGPCPPGLICCHSCHHPWCVNPRHVRWDTYAANQADRRSDRTDNRGEKHPLARLTEVGVSEIRRRAALGERLVDLAAEFGVHPNTVQDVVVGRAWNHGTTLS